MIPKTTDLSRGIVETWANWPCEPNKVTVLAQALIAAWDALKEAEDGCMCASYGVHCPVCKEYGDFYTHEIEHAPNCKLIAALPEEKP